MLACALILVSSFAIAQPSAAKQLLWTDPGDVASRDLFYGVGGKQHVPRPPFQFLGEDTEGSNPKFDVKDAAGTRWKVKLGIESRPEVAASRLLWAIGYFVNENYYLLEPEIDGLTNLHRGDQFVKGSRVEDARLQRRPAGEEKAGKWSWRHNPFSGTREFDGLRVIMALISNWDLKDENNAVYQDKHDSGSQHYLVSDVGTAFGTSGKSTSSEYSKSNLGAYSHHRLVSKIAIDYVDLNFPTHPSIVHFLEFPFFWGQVRNRWIGRHIPRDHVRWIASLLAQLRPEQIEDAFRAAGYPPQQAKAYSQAVEARIAELKKI